MSAWEGKGRPWDLGRAGPRVLGAGQEGHPAPSNWAFLLLNGPVTSSQLKASLTQQAEEGGKAKQLRHRAGHWIRPAPVWLLQ